MPGVAGTADLLLLGEVSFREGEIAGRGVEMVPVCAEIFSDSPGKSILFPVFCYFSHVSIRLRSVIRRLADQYN
jgi:hypothetical protein